MLPSDVMPRKPVRKTKVSSRRIRRDVQIVLGRQLTHDDLSEMMQYTKRRLTEEHGVAIQRYTPYVAPGKDKDSSLRTTISIPALIPPAIGSVIGALILHIMKQWLKRRFPPKSSYVIVQIHGPRGEVISEVSKPTINPKLTPLNDKPARFKPL